MSQLSAADVYARLVNDYIAHCQVALAVYEYLVTIDQEISMVWKRKITAASVLLLASRSLMVLDPIFEVIPVSSQASCQAGLFLSDITFAFNQIVVALFSALRVYAISQQVQKKKIISGLVFGLSIIPLATNIFNWSRTTIVWQPDSGGCAVMSALSEDLNNRLLLLTRSSAIVMDVVVVAMTWANSFRHFREMRRLKLHSSITAVLLRDGTLYFIALLAINVAQCLTFNTSSNISNYVQPFLQFMPSVLVQRFMLNLRQLSERADESRASTGPSASRFSLHFRVPSDFLGNLGQPLEHGLAEHADEDVSGDEFSGSGRETLSVI